MDAQTHLMLLKVTVHKIQLSVRFPCSLTFQLKVQNKIIDCRGSYQLLKGVCTPEETLRLEAELEKKQDNNYRDKQAKIIIFMTSANGKIPAGSATINLGSQRLGSSQVKTLGIQKCPDKSASINFTFSLQYLRNVAKNISQAKSSSIYGKLEESIISSASRIRVSNVGEFRSAGEKHTRNSPERRVFNSSSVYQLMNRNVPEHDFDQDSKRGSRVSGSGFGDDQDLLKKVVNLEKQKTQQMKQLSKLKKQLGRQQVEDKTQVEQHFNRLKSQYNQISIQSEVLKQKLKNYERRQKQLLTTIKQLKQQIERKKQKNYQQQFSRMENQSIIDEKQKTIREMQIGLKQYEQQISDLKISLSTQQKRIQFKEIGLKDQLNKLNEKYQQSQLQRQKAVMELNAMLEELEISEKKNQLSIKQKDKIHAEQKNKLIKKSQTLSRTIQQQKQLIDEKIVQVSDLQRQLKILQAKFNENQNESGQNKIQLKNTVYELEKERELTINLKRQLQKYQQLQRQFIDFRKKYQDLELQDQTNKKSLQNSLKTNQQLQNKLRQLEQQLGSKAQEISSLMTKLHNLTLQVESYRKQEENFNRQAQTLSINNLNAANKIEELRGKLDQLQMAYNELQVQSEQQIAYIIKTKQYTQSQLQQAKWNCQKFKDQSQQITTKNKNLSNQILQLNRRLLELQQKNNKLDQQVADLKSNIAINLQQKQMQVNKEKDLQERLKQKNDQIYQLNKKITKIEKEYFMLAEKQKHTQKFYSEKLESEQGLNKNKQTRINQSIETINKLQIEIIEKQQAISQLQAFQVKLTNEYQFLKQQLKLVKKQNSEYIQKINLISEQNASLMDKLNSTSTSLQQEKSSKSQLSQNLSKKTKQFEQYRSANNSALEQLLQQMGKQLNINSTTNEFSLLSFPEQRFSSLQVQSMKKRNNIIIKYQQQVKSLETQVKNLDEEINKLKKQHLYRQQELQSIIQNEKLKFKNFHSDLSLEKQELIEKISGLDDKVFEITTENQKLRIQVEQAKAYIIDQENLVHQLNFQIENSKNEIKTLQQAIKTGKQQILKLKTSYQNSLLNSTGQSSAQIQKLKKIILQNEKKIQSTQKCVAQKQQYILKLQSSLQNINLQKEKSDQKLLQINNRFNDLSLERKAGQENQRNYERLIKKNQEAIVRLENQISAVSKKYQEVQIQRKKVQDALSQQQLLRAKLQGQLQIANELSNSLEQMLKDTDTKSKKSTEKSTTQLKKLKQQIINLNSAIDLKSFQISQHQSTIKSLKTTNQQLVQEIANKKEQISGLQAKFQDTKNGGILATQELQGLRTEKNALQNQVRVLKQSIINLQQMLSQNQTNLQTMVLKQRQITRLKQQIGNKERTYEKYMQDFKGQINQAKKQISIRAQRQQQYKKKIRDLQSQIETHLYDAETQKKNWEENADSQRKKLLYELEGVKEENKLLAEQFQFQREQMNSQLDQAAQQIAHLRQIINESQQKISNSSSYNAEQFQKIKNLELQLKNCRQQWQKQKLAYIPTQKKIKQIESQISRYQKYAVQLQKKNKQLTELAKKRLTEEPKSSCGDLLREINTVLLRNKSKIISRCGERERDQVIADFKLIHEKIEGAIKSYHIMLK